MKFIALRRKPTVADRLLELRSRAGADPAKHAHFHRLVNRYQRKMLLSYGQRRRSFLWRWLRQNS